MRGAIFDMDGLLLDSEKIYQRSWHALARERGLTLPSTFAQEITGTGTEQSRLILRKYYPSDDPDRLLAACKERVMAMEETELDPKPGAAALLKALHDAGWKLAVASSSPRDMVEKNLKKTGLDQWMHQIVCGNEVRHGKPAPDIFLLAAQRLGLDPSLCLVLEDSPSGLRAAQAAGCRPVMVPDQVPPTPELTAFCAVYPSLLHVLEDIQAGKL